MVFYGLGRFFKQDNDLKCLILLGSAWPRLPNTSIIRNFLKLYPNWASPWSIYWFSTNFPTVVGSIFKSSFKLLSSLHTGVSLDISWWSWWCDLTEYILLLLQECTTVQCILKVEFIQISFRADLKNVSHLDLQDSKLCSLISVRCNWW